MTQPEAMAFIARFDPRQQGLPLRWFPGKQSDYLPGLECEIRVGSADVPV